MSFPSFRPLMLSHILISPNFLTVDIYERKWVKLAGAFKVDIYRRVFACLRKLCKVDCLTVSACHAK